jgi:hypothetical protein
MIKLLGVMALALAGTAQADTITMQGENCGIIKQCVAVPNDSPTKVDIYGAPGYAYFYVYLTDADPITGAPVTVTYFVDQASGYGVIGAVGQSFYWVGLGLPGSYKVFTGQMLTITDAFTSYRTCNHTGRGQTCSTRWVLSPGGTITR